ncbi:MAG: hypothetical protein HC802_12580 [Caldilineaceae bacterium]|nr:hypothetical protein [Caldilineaceae bacterium]
MLDRVAFSGATDLRQERAALRETASNLPRADDRSPLMLNEEEFTAITRRALSQLGNLPKLAASPLVHLEIIDRRLASAGLDDNTLTRAAELKALLIEAIDALGPAEANGFDPSEAWRFYNALHYPYVVGIKPYRRRPTPASLDAESQAALDWLRTEVPERTLYNWQNAGAQLVATHLREISSAPTTEFATA